MVGQVSSVTLKTISPRLLEQCVSPPRPHLSVVLRGRSAAIQPPTSSLYPAGSSNRDVERSNAVVTPMSFASSSQGTGPRYVDPKESAARFRTLDTQLLNERKKVVSKVYDDDDDSDDDVGLLTCPNATRFFYCTVCSVYLLQCECSFHRPPYR